MGTDDAGSAGESLSRRWRVAVIGSRDFSQMEKVVEYIDSLNPKTIIVSGLARGVDTVARTRAIERGMNVVDVPALWDSQGRGAGFRRNSIIMEIADEAVAFWDGQSKGTEHSIGFARKHGLRVEVHYGSRREG